MICISHKINCSNILFGIMRKNIIKYISRQNIDLYIPLPLTLDFNQPQAHNSLKQFLYPK